MTLTEGKMEVKQYVSISKNNQEFEKIVGNLAKALEDSNATILAIKDKFSKIEKSWEKKVVIPFSSQTKWSGVTFEKEGSYLLGAPEILLGKDLSKFEKEVVQEAKEYRVLAIVHTKETLKEGTKELPKEIEVVGFLYLRDKIRKEAKDTLNYFKEQGVDIKIISGDNVLTVAQIAKRVGMEHYEKYIDCATL